MSLAESFKEECQMGIYISSRGAVVYAHRLEDKYPEELKPGSRIWPIIEDNIVNDEWIDWEQVWKECELPPQSDKPPNGRKNG